MAVILTINGTPEVMPADAPGFAQWFAAQLAVYRNDSDDIIREGIRSIELDTEGQEVLLERPLRLDRIRAGQVDIDFSKAYLLSRGGAQTVACSMLQTRGVHLTGLKIRGEGSGFGLVTGQAQEDVEDVRHMNGGQNYLSRCRVTGVWKTAAMVCIAAENNREDKCFWETSSPNARCAAAYLADNFPDWNIPAIDGLTPSNVFSESTYHATESQYWHRAGGAEAAVIVHGMDGLIMRDPYCVVSKGAYLVLDCSQNNTGNCIVSGLAGIGHDTGPPPVGIWFKGTPAGKFGNVTIESTRYTRTSVAGVRMDAAQYSRVRVNHPEDQVTVMPGATFEDCDLGRRAEVVE